MLAAMATVQEGLQAQILNIEATYGRSIAEWTSLIAATGLRKHGQIVAMLKTDHGLSHGSANRVALVALASLEPSPTVAGADPAEALLDGRKGGVRPIFEALMATVHGFGPELELAHKKGYVSLRRRT